MQRIYDVAQAHRVPVLMHWQFEMYNYGFERFDTMLEKYPQVNFIGPRPDVVGQHRRGTPDQSVLYPKGPVTPGGLTDRYLSRLPNMFGDSVGWLRAQRADTGRGFRARLPDSSSGQTPVRQRLQRSHRVRRSVPGRTDDCRDPAALTEQAS